jgi:hypothetical protein
LLDPWYADLSGWQKTYRRCVVIVALSSLCACSSGDQTDASKSRDGSERTIKVLSTRDDSPIPGVNVEVRAVARLGEFGPETDLRVWFLTTDAAGEVRVTPPPLTKRLEVYVEGNARSTQSNSNIKYYEKHQGPKRDRKRELEDTQYLTPVVDVDYEQIRYAYRAASDVIAGKVKVGSKPIIYLVDRYSQAKEYAKSERELAALREFCRFSEIVEAEAENDWPTLGAAHFYVSRGQMLINDCAASDELSLDKSVYEVPAVPLSTPTSPVTVRGGTQEPPLEASVRKPAPGL